MDTEYGHTLFTEEQVTGAIRELSDYETYQDMASLSLEGEIPPEVLTAFANLAKSLKLPVSSKYSSLCVRRRKPDSELRDIAVARLQRQAEAGEIEAKAA